MDERHEGLAEENERLRARLAARDERLRVVVHDLRTPLAVMTGLVETMQEHSDRLSAAETRDLLERLGRQTERLNSMLDRIHQDPEEAVGQSS